MAITWTAIGIGAAGFLGLTAAMFTMIFNFNARFDGFNARFDALGARIDGFEASLGARIDSLSARIDSLAARLDAHIGHAG